jgi:hypothetical protein
MSRLANILAAARQPAGRLADLSGRDGEPLPEPGGFPLLRLG